MLKNLFLSACLLAPVASWAVQNIVDEIVWVVGDEVILRSDVEEERIKALYQKEDIKGDPYCYIPEQLAMQKLYLDQAKLDSLNIDDKQVEQQVEQRLAYLKEQMRTDEQIEKYFGKSMPVIRTELSDMVRNQMTIQQEQHKIVGDVKPTPAEVRRFFNHLPKDSVPDVPEMVELQIISVSPFIRPEAIDDVRARLKDFKSRIEKGESSFSTLATLYSDDPGSARNGGELGFMRKGQLVPEYAEVAFALKDSKKISRIVKSDFGYHIIQLIERDDDRVNTRHILLKPRILFTDRDSARSLLDSVANQVRLSKLTFEQAVMLYSTDKATSKSQGVLANPRTGDVRFKPTDFSPEMTKVINGLQIGEISKAFPMKNSIGDDTYTVIRLRNRVPAHKANMTEDYQVLRDLYVARRSEEKLHEWIRKKQSSVYVLVSKKWQDCSFEFPGWVKDDVVK